MENIKNDRPRPAEQFNVGHQEYTTFIETDPIRNYLHYPKVMEELGELRDQHILDIGCGDGLFDRKLAERGAKITGYDISPNLIRKAEQEENLNPMGIKYVLSDPTRFSSTEHFDSAIAVMVLPYSTDETYIKNFFASAHQHLKDGGKFITIVFNPEFIACDKVIANRFFRKSTGNKIQFDFLNPLNGTVAFNAELAQFSRIDYETAAKEGGFKTVQWKSLEPSKEGVEKFGKDFWEEAVNVQPYALIIAEK